MSLRDFSEYPTPPSAEGGLPLRSVIAWIIILGIIAMILIGAAAAQRRPVQTDADPSRVTSTNLVLQARYAVGVHAVMRLAQRSLDERQREQLLRGIDQPMAPIDRLRAIPVIAELAGTEPALERLDEIQPLLEDPVLQQDAELLRTLYTAGPDALEPAHREQLTRNHGWFARLALTHQAPPDDPMRRDVLAAAHRTFFTTLALVLGAVVALLAGLVLLIIAIVRIAGGTLRWRYQYHPGKRPLFLDIFALYLVGTFVTMFAARALLGIEGPLLVWFVAVIVPGALVWFLYLGVGWEHLRNSLGWHGGRGLSREIGAGIVGYIAGLPLVAGAFLLTLLLSQFARAQPVHPIIHEIQHDWRVIVQLYLLAVIAAPLVEETMFRGVLYHYMRARWSWIISGLVTGVIFAAVHPQGWTAIPLLGAIGFVFAVIREWRASLVAPIFAHGLNNFIAITFIVLALT